MNNEKQLQQDLERKINMLKDLIDIRSISYDIVYDQNNLSADMDQLVSELNTVVYKATQLARKEMVDARRALTNYELMKQFNNESTESE